MSYLCAPISFCSRQLDSTFISFVLSVNNFPSRYRTINTLTRSTSSEAENISDIPLFYIISVIC